jgi:hypothetical protein
LHSRTAILDGFNFPYKTFKIDHAYDIRNFATQPMAGGAVYIESIFDYLNSPGAEFIIAQDSLISAGYGCAIRKTLAYSISLEKLRTARDFLYYGGFKINQTLTPKEAKENDGLIEMLVAKNNATSADYTKAKEILSQYVDEASARGCFSDGNGIILRIYIEGDYRARLSFVSDVSTSSFFSGHGSEGHICSVLKHFSMTEGLVLDFLKEHEVSSPAFITGINAYANNHPVSRREQLPLATATKL